jgi:hypothetical protein
MSQENVTKPIGNQSSTGDIAFALSLTGGILITIGSVIGMGLEALGRPFFWGMGGIMGGYNMMGVYYGTAGYYGVMYFLEFVALIAGILVLVFAAAMRSKPSNLKTYGALVMAFSLISLVGMGGFLVGAILGLIGGILALVST